MERTVSRVIPAGRAVTVVKCVFFDIVILEWKNAGRGSRGSLERTEMGMEMEMEMEIDRVKERGRKQRQQEAIEIRFRFLCWRYYLSGSRHYQNSGLIPGKSSWHDQNAESMALTVVVALIYGRCQIAG